MGHCGGGGAVAGAGRPIRDGDRDGDGLEGNGEAAAAAAADFGEAKIAALEGKLAVPHVLALAEEAAFGGARRGFVLFVVPGRRVVVGRGGEGLADADGDGGARLDELS
eukprot:CAMPEP_0197414770 /NCGR_PEP_ID=MMETSP1170-20131217/1462_1 /TAXON_ID=54406 /ORGANISM="Sarcinochrysis sp, Strain CCMP770" /LENGTH=108 /DNA_ID=CAMNT_0042941517 /DNA_START=118 /DNA_END=440 /DNA_ORIENTATION=+